MVRGCTVIDANYFSDQRARHLQNNPKDAAGNILCLCGAAMTPKEWSCPECAEKAKKKAVLAEREREAHRMKSAFDGFMYGRGYEEPLTHPPYWEWARFENESFRKRSSRKITSAVERWSPSEGGLIVSGPTGRGKTGAIVAWLYRMRDGAIAKARAGEKASIVPFAFVSGPELSGSRRRWKIGQEAPIVRHAIKHGVLFLDEVGFEPLSEELFFTIDHRYRLGAPTVITTGLRPKEFRDRYGDALYRRVAEGGAVVEDWPA